MTDKHIIYESDAKNCEQCSSDSVCCYCKNITCYKLEEQLRRAEQKLEKIKQIINTHKQNECITCSEFDECLGHPYCDEVILQIIEGKENG